MAETPCDGNRARRRFSLTPRGHPATVAASMLRRLGVISLLIFQAVWLNVIVPAHPRGVLTLPSWDDTNPADAAHACCATPQQRDDSTGAGGHKPAQDRAAH